MNNGTPLLLPKTVLTATQFQALKTTYINSFFDWVPFSIAIKQSKWNSDTDYFLSWQMVQQDMVSYLNTNKFTFFDLNPLFNFSTKGEHFFINKNASSLSKLYTDIYTLQTSKGASTVVLQSILKKKFHHSYVQHGFYNNKPYLLLRSFTHTYGINGLSHSNNIFFKKNDLLGQMRTQYISSEVYKIIPVYYRQLEKVTVFKQAQQELYVCHMYFPSKAAWYVFVNSIRTHSSTTSNALSGFLGNAFLDPAMGVDMNDGVLHSFFKLE